MKEARIFSIMQYNMRKDKDGTMAEFLRDEEVLGTDVIAVQEPWGNKYCATTHHPQKQLYHLVWPTDEIPEVAGRYIARVCFFIHKRIDQATTKVTSHSTTFQTAVFDFRKEGTHRKIAIHNIYCLPAEKAEKVGILPAERTIALLEQQIEAHSDCEQIALGDFNAWHPEWFGRPVSPTGQATTIKRVMEEHGLSLWLEPGTITRPGERIDGSSTGSTIDLVWGTPQIEENLIECQTAGHLAKSSDHLPIRTLLNITPTKAPIQEEWLYKKADWERYREALAATLPQCDQIYTQLQLEQAAEELTSAVKNALDQAVPRMRRTPKMRPGWNEECSEAIRTAKRAKRQWQAIGGESDYIDWKESEKEKKKVLQRALTDDHREKVSNIEDDTQLWGISKWIRNRGAIRAAYMPWIRDLQGNEQHENEGKARALQERLFPEPPPADLSDIPEAPVFPKPLPFPDITEDEVRKVLQYAPNDKAPGADGIQNRVLKAGIIELTPVLTRIYNASLRLQHWPTQWKEARVVILRKPGKSDYHDPKSYRPISLLQTLSKIMEGVLATRIAAIAELNDLLPRTHCGGRKASSGEHAIHLLLEQIQAAWNNKEVASLMLLDISGAFDNVNHRRLLWNIRELGYHENLVGWLGSFITGRTGRTRLNEGLMAPFDITTGIPQGSPLSPILWLLYNYKALQIAQDRALVTGYIDDTCIMVTGKTTKANCHRLEGIHEEMHEWANRHGAAFAPQKYELIHFYNSRQEKKAPEGEWQATVTIRSPKGETKVHPSGNARYLGVWLDSKLTGEAHLEKALKKANTQKEALRSITGAGWGANPHQMVKLYKSTVLPRLSYGCSTWVTQARGLGYQAYWTKAQAKLRTFQRTALAAITGAFKSTAGPALDVEFNVEPIAQYMIRTAMATANRIRSSPSHKLMLEIRQAGLPACARKERATKAKKRKPGARSPWRASNSNSMKSPEPPKTSPSKRPKPIRGTMVRAPPGTDCPEQRRSGRMAR